MVSVVMATYNGEQFIEEQLLSILNQTRKPDEMIIYDDGSTDNTIQIINDFIDTHKLRNWILFVNPINLGVAQNFFEAAKKTRGDIIFWSDQDDIWHSKKIEKMACLIEKNSQIYALLCNKSFIDKNGKTINPIVRKGFKLHSLTKVSMFSKFNIKSVPGMCMAVRRNILDYIFQHNNLHYPNHDHTCAYIASSMNGFYFYNEVLAYHRRHTDNLSGANLKRARNPDERTQNLQNQLDLNVFALKVLDDILDKDTTKNEKQFMSMCKKINKLRIRNFKRKNVLPLIFMFRYISKGYPLKSYIGDIIYTLNLERLFSKG